MWRRKSKQVNADVSYQRNAALGAIPCQTPPVKREEKEGKLFVTIAYNRPRWQRVMGADEKCDRTFGLDGYGQQVYANCNGRQSVKQIVANFAKQSHVSKPEAELAVTKFLRTLLSKGLVYMKMEKPSS